ncbi:MAG: hypothetical protein KBE23_04995 [Chloroflexi bacterium]|nr:hypothetical protein [Chloroflexota bacterium]MBP7042076.1 hypothetical protein [Chloroflexota bacterium]
MKSLRLFLHRFPITLGLLLTLALVALTTNSHASRLEPDWLTQLGFASRDFWEVRWGRLFTSALVTLGGSVFWQAIGMVSLAVGAAEYLTGSKQTFAVFWGVHLTTLLTTGLIVNPILHWLVFNGDSLLLWSRDVGPSAGYFGALGFAVAALPVRRRWRWLLAAAIFAGLVLTVWQTFGIGEDGTLKLLADIAHLIAFPLGAAAWPIIRYFGRRRQAAPPKLMKGIQ